MGDAYQSIKHFRLVFCCKFQIDEYMEDSEKLGDVFKQIFTLLNT